MSVNLLHVCRAFRYDQIEPASCLQSTQTWPNITYFWFLWLGSFGLLYLKQSLKIWTKILDVEIRTNFSVAREICSTFVEHSYMVMLHVCKVFKHGHLEFFFLLFSLECSVHWVRIFQSKTLETPQSIICKIMGTNANVQRGISHLEVHQLNKSHVINETWLWPSQFHVILILAMLKLVHL